MPKRRPSDAIHVLMTDHWIQRTAVFSEPTGEDRRPYAGPVVSFYTKADPVSLAIANIRELKPDVIGLYRRHLKRDAGDVGTLAALGSALFRLDKRTEAVEVLERALRLDPKHAGALNTLAVAGAIAGDHAKAIALLERARSSHPDHALTWFNLGVTYQAMNRPGEAEGSFREAIRLQPDFSEARMRLAALQARR